MQLSFNSNVYSFFKLFLIVLSFLVCLFLLCFVSMVDNITVLLVRQFLSDIFDRDNVEIVTHF